MNLLQQVFETLCLYLLRWPCHLQLKHYLFISKYVHCFFDLQGGPTRNESETLRVPLPALHI